jgi:hypothetical protein
MVIMHRKMWKKRHLEYKYLINLLYLWLHIENNVYKYDYFIVFVNGFGLFWDRYHFDKSFKFSLSTHIVCLFKYNPNLFLNISPHFSNEHCIK